MQSETVTARKMLLSDVTSPSASSTIFSAPFLTAKTLLPCTSLTLVTLFGFISFLLKNLFLFFRFSSHFSPSSNFIEPSVFSDIIAKTSENFSKNLSIQIIKIYARTNQQPAKLICRPFVLLTKIHSPTLLPFTHNITIQMS